MSTSYPGALDTLTNPSGTDALNSPSHAGQHANANDAIEAIQAELGTDPAGAYASVRARLDTRLKYVPLSAGTAVSSTTAATIGVTATPELSGLPVGSVMAYVQLAVASSTANANNSLRVWSGTDSTILQGQAYAPPVANYTGTVYANVPMTSDRKFYYSVVRGAGTITYSVTVLGYWIAD